MISSTENEQESDGFVGRGPNESDVPFSFNGLQGPSVKARLRRFANRIKPASNDSRSVQGFIHQGVSTVQMEKLDAAERSAARMPAQSNLSHFERIPEGGKDVG